MKTLRRLGLYFVTLGVLLGALTGCKTSESSESAQEALLAVTWKNDDGSVLRETRVKEGEVPVYDAALPTSSDTDALGFLAWDKPLVAIYEDTTFVAQYRYALAETFKTTSDTNVSGTKDNGVIFLEKNDEGFIEYTKLSAASADTEWYIEAHISNFQDEVYHNTDPDSDEYTAASWKSFGVGALDVNGNELLFEPELPSPLTVDYEERNVHDSARRLGVVITEAENSLNYAEPICPAGTRYLLGYDLKDFTLAVYRKNDNYSCYVNGMKVLVYTPLKNPNYDCSGADYPALLSRSIGVTYDNIKVAYGADARLLLPMNEIAYETSYNARNYEHPELVDLSKYDSQNKVTFASTNVIVEGPQYEGAPDNVVVGGQNYVANAVYNGVGRKWGFKAHFSGFDRASGMIGLAFKTGTHGATKYVVPGTGATDTLGHDWGNQCNFGIFPTAGGVNFGYRADGYNPAYQTAFLEWTDYKTCDFDVELIWSEGTAYGRVIGRTATSGSVDSGWFKFDLTSNGYFSTANKGNYVSPTIISFRNNGTGTASNIEYIAGDAVILPTEYKWAIRA